MAKSTAQRSADYRERQKCGIKIEPLEVDHDLAYEYFVTSDRKTKAEFLDDETRRHALALILEQHMQLNLRNA
jgi:hypothetical protein